jgi:signal peptidase I
MDAPPEVLPVKDPDSVPALRRRARWRATFWPGGGLALLGYSRLALIGYIIVPLSMLTLFYASFTFDSVAAWAALIVFLSSALFWLVECIAVGYIPIVAQQKQNRYSRHFIPLCAAGYALGIFPLLLCFFNVGWMRMAGIGMSPTILNREYILFQKRIPSDLKRQQLIVFRNSPEAAWGRPSDVIVARILAGPGDRLSARDGQYLVNGSSTWRMGATGKLEPAISLPTEQDALMVPSECYFVVQDNPPNAFDSQVLSWVKQDRIIGTNIFLFGGRGFGIPAQ